MQIGPDVSFDVVQAKKVEGLKNLCEREFDKRMAEITAEYDVCTGDC